MDEEPTPAEKKGIEEINRALARHTKERRKRRALDQLIEREPNPLRTTFDEDAGAITSTLLYDEKHA